MPVSVVIGGQFGSEGKGKVALDTAQRLGAAAVIRVGGTNSGHTAIAPDGNLRALRQLPVAALTQNALSVLPPGSLVDIEIFHREVSELGLSPERVKLDPRATVISRVDREAEHACGLSEAIGSTGSGTGAALQRRISRRDGGSDVQASDYEELQPFLSDTTSLLRSLLDKGERIIVEGTQGFGLSLLHSEHYPKVTSRDTTAAAFVAEAGLSPLDVDDVILVIRTFPIRVAGNSGPLFGETTWSDIAKQAGLPENHHELTTVTKKVRRIGQFDPRLVKRAIDVNNPTQIVLNHLDYVDVSVQQNLFSRPVRAFVEEIELSLGRKINWLGTGPVKLHCRSAALRRTINGSRLDHLEMATPPSV